MADNYHRSRVITRRKVGVVALLLSLVTMLFGQTVHTQRANAQAVEIAGGIAAVKGALEASDELADLLCGESSGLDDCIKEKIADSAKFKECMDKDDADLTKCLEDLAKDDEDDDEEADDAPAKIKQNGFASMSSALAGAYTSEQMGGQKSDSDSDKDKDSDSSSGDDEDKTTDEQTSKKKDTDTDFFNSYLEVLDNTGNAGAFVGYVNPEITESEWEDSGRAQNERQFTNNQGILHGKRVDNGPDFAAGAYNYVNYGSTLAGLHLDTTQNTQGLSGGLRTIAGSAVALAFVGSGGVDAIFDVALKFMQYMNPFKFLVDATDSNTNDFNEGIRNAGELDGSLDGFKDLMTTLYKGGLHIGWYVTIPVSIGMVVVLAMLSRRFDRSRGIRNLVIRTAALVVLIPLLGVTYTSGLDSMEGAAGKSARSKSAEMIQSTYVDFGSWADNAMLAPPSQNTLKWDADANAPSEESQTNLRKTTFMINQMAHGNGESISSRDIADAGSSDQWLRQHITRDGDSESSKNAFTSTISMLTDYIKGSTYDSSKIWNVVRDQIGDDEEKQKFVTDYISESDVASADKEDVAKNPLLSSGTALGKNDNGFTQNGERCSVSGTNWFDGMPSCTMSPVSFYNYLNSRFDPGKATVFSTDRSVSQYSRESHPQVNAVGNTATQVIYWMSTMALLVSFTIIGFAYALTLIFRSLKRTFQLLTSIPFAMMGFLAGIAKVIIYTAALFIELFGTIVVYKLVQEFLYALATASESLLTRATKDVDLDPIAARLGLGGSAAGLAQNPTVALIVTALGALIIIIFTLMALKLRSAFVSGVDEAITRFVNKLTGTSVSSGTAGGGNNALRQGIARGAGFAAANRAAGLAGSATSDGADGGAGGDSQSGAGETQAVSGDESTFIPAAGAGAGAAGIAAGGGIDADDSGAGIADGDDGDNEYQATGDEESTMIPADGSVGEAAGADTDELVSGGVYTGDDTPGIDGESGSNFDADAIGASGATIDSDGMVTDGDTGEVLTGTDGQPMSIDSAAPADDNGNLVGAGGKALTDPTGQSIPQSVVSGISPEGHLLGSDGMPLLDSQGEPIEAGSGQAALDSPGIGGNIDTASGGDMPSLAAPGSDMDIPVTDTSGSGLAVAGGEPLMTSGVSGVNDAGQLVGTNGTPIYDQAGSVINAEATNLGGGAELAGVGAGAAGAASAVGAAGSMHSGMSQAAQSIPTGGRALGDTLPHGGGNVGTTATPYSGSGHLPGGNNTTYATGGSESTQIPSGGAMQLGDRRAMPNTPQQSGMARTMAASAGGAMLGQALGGSGKNNYGTAGSALKDSMSGSGKDKGKGSARPQGGQLGNVASQAVRHSSYRDSAQSHNTRGKRGQKSDDNNQNMSAQDIRRMLREELHKRSTGGANTVLGGGSDSFDGGGHFGGPSTLG